MCSFSQASKVEDLTDRLAKHERESIDALAEAEDVTREIIARAGNRSDLWNQVPQREKYHLASLLVQQNTEEKCKEAESLARAALQADEASPALLPDELDGWRWILDEAMSLQRQQRDTKATTDGSIENLQNLHLES